jgi:predicted ester cyclase
MSDKIESRVRSYLDSLNKKDIDGALSFFTDDSKWYAPEGTFEGKEEIKGYINWMLNAIPDISFAEEGIGIISQGNIAVCQHSFGGTVEGIKVKVPSICVYEFSGENCKNHWSYYDRLSLAKQAVTGPIAKKAVNTLISRLEKGL